MLSPAEAARTILESIERKSVESVPLIDALGRVLAQDITSPIDLPHRDNSGMDGYAVVSSDVRDKCPVNLEIIEEIPAGAVPVSVVTSGKCARIFTGAPIPEGADSVIRQEHTSIVGERRVQINSDGDAGKNVRRRGEDLRKGTVVIEQGTELRPAHLGVLGSTAFAEAPVYGAPKVAVLATGDEIADLEERELILNGKKIGSSNTYTMLSMVKDAGGVPIRMGIARDDADDVRRRFVTATESADLIVTSGGVSVGDHDHLRAVFEELGGELVFWRIRMQPGKPVAFGILNNTPWIGLPGNPVSTMVTFELLVRPAIRMMLGHSKPFRQVSAVRMGEKVTIRSERTQFLRAIVDRSSDPMIAKTTGPQGSGILYSMAKANALLIIPGGPKEVPSGETVRAIFLDDPTHVAEVPY